MNMGISPERLADLAAEFPRADIHWRAQTVTERDGKHKALALAYLDARNVMERLDDVCGPQNWSDRMEETAKGRIICTLSINIDGEWVTKSDGAGATDVEADKGALSDALKRAAVKWGIGRYLYSLPNVWVPCEVGNNGKFRKFTDDPWKHVPVSRTQAPRPDPTPKTEPTISDAQYVELLALITAAGTDTAAFLRFYGVSAVDKLPASQFQHARDNLNKKKETV